MRPARTHSLGGLTRLALLCCLALCLGRVAPPLLAANAAAGPAPPAAPAPSANPAPAALSAPASGLSVNVEGLPLVDFLRLMGQFTGRSPVFRDDQVPRTQVTVLTRQSADQGTLDALFGLVLQAAALHTARTGDVLYVLPGAVPGLAQRPLAEGMHLLAMRLPPGQSPERVARLLERLRSDSGLVLSSEKAWAVLLADAPERVARARSVLDLVADAPAGSRTELLPLRKALAKLAARKLDMYFRGLPGRPPGILALDWSNTVLLCGSEEQLSQASRLLAQMDDAPREAPALKAFRLRYVRAEKVAALIAELMGKGAQAGVPAEGQAPQPTLRITVDEEANAVVVLAEPEMMARLEAVVAELDQPKPRILLEVVVVELPAAMLGELAVTGGSMGAPAGADALVLDPVQARGRKFTSSAAGAAVAFRGKVAEDMDALATLLSAEPKAHVLAKPRAAAQDGGEVRVSAAAQASSQAGAQTAPRPTNQSSTQSVSQSAGQAAAQATASSTALADRFRLVLSPRLEADGVLLVTVRLEDGADPGPAYVAEVRMNEGQVLLFKTAKDALGQEQGGSGNWTLLSPKPKAEETGNKLALALTAKVVRQSAPSRGLGAPAEGSEAVKQPTIVSEHP